MALLTRIPSRTKVRSYSTSESGQQREIKIFTLHTAYGNLKQHITYNWRLTPVKIKSKLLRHPVASLALGGLVVGLAWGFTPLLFGSQAQACGTVPSNTGRETFQVTAPTAGKYQLWSRIRTGNAAVNSYYLQIDTTCAIRVAHRALAVNQFVWVNYQDGNTATHSVVNLAAGKHTVRAIGAETGLLLDRVLLTTDLKCVPVSFGENCASLNNPKVVNPYACPKHPLVKVGSTGACVKRVQWFLNYGSKAGLAIDGDFGPLTDKAVRRYQAAHHLQVDGQVGPKTWASLEN